MDWSLVDYCDIFISCLDSNSDGAHSLQRIHWWASDLMLNFSKSLLMKKQGDAFSANLYFWVKCSSKAKLKSSFVKISFLIAYFQNMLSFCIAKGRSLQILMRFVRKLRQRQIALLAKTKAFHRSLSICASIRLMVLTFMHIQTFNHDHI